MLENEVLNNVMKALLPHQKKIRFWRQNTGGAIPFSTARKIIQEEVMAQLEEVLGENRARAFANNLIWKLSGRIMKFSVNGAHDITGITNEGKRLEIEIKSEKGKMSEDQINFAEMIEKYQGIQILGRSPEEVLDKLKDKHIL